MPAARYADPQRIPPESERHFQQVVVDLALRLGWRVHFVHDSRHSPDGWPDLFLVRGPQMIAAELKTLTGKVSPAQWAWLEALEAAGVPCFVWRPDDKARIVRTLSER